jgi:hypothetical protein
MFRIFLTTVSAAALLLASAPVLAHDVDLHSTDIKPRVGRMSDEVIVQRLRLAGVENAQVVSRRDDVVVVRGAQAGQPKQFEVEALSGRVFDLSGGQRRLIIGGGAIEPRPMINGAQIPQERERFANPELMRNAVVQNRLPERLQPH